MVNKQTNFIQKGHFKRILKIGILRQYGDLKKLLHVIQKDHEKTPRKLISFFLFIKQRMIETKKTKSKCILKLLLLKTNYL